MQTKLTNWLQSQLQDNTLKIIDFSKPTAGASNETLILKVSHQVNGALAEKGMVLRLASSEISLFETYDLNFQYKVQQHLSKSKLPIPKLVGNFESDLDVLGREFYVMEMIEGRVPNENPLYHSEGWLHTLTPSEIEDLWLSGVGMTGEINGLDWRQYGLEFLLKDTLEKNLLQTKLAELERYLDWTESLARPYPSIRMGLDWLKLHQPSSEPTALCWGDAKLGNCLFKGTKCVAALDWEGANLGNPVSDLAWWLILDHALSYGYGVPRLAGLPSKETTIKHWEKHSGFEANHLPYYEIFAAVKFSIIMARSGKIWMDKGWMSHELEFDINNGAHKVLSDLLSSKEK